jgi:hypothetical protein
MLGPEPSGPGEDMSKQPGHGLLDLHNPWGVGDDSAHASRSKRRDQQALTGLINPVSLAALTGPSRLPLRAASGRP